MIKAIIFDFDGVLVESVNIKTEAFAELFNSESRGITKKIVEYHLQHTGVSRFDKFRYIYRNILKQKITENKFEELCQKFAKLVKNKVINAPYVKGAKEFLHTHTSRYKCFVLSATPQKEIREIIRRKGMLRYFVGIYGSPPEKKIIVRTIIRKNNLKPKDIVYIGDAKSDYEAATANSVNFIARSNNNEFIFSDINCIKLKDLTYLKKVLDKL